jgi:hypothetical protein
MLKRASAKRQAGAGRFHVSARFGSEFEVDAATHDRRYQHLHSVVGWYDPEPGGGPLAKATSPAESNDTRTVAPAGAFISSISRLAARRQRLAVDHRSPGSVRFPTIAPDYRNRAVTRNRLACPLRVVERCDGPSKAQNQSHN